MCSACKPSRRAIASVGAKHVNFCGAHVVEQPPYLNVLVCCSDWMAVRPVTLVALAATDLQNKSSHPQQACDDMPPVQTRLQTSSLKIAQLLKDPLES